MRESDHQIGLHGLALLRAKDAGDVAWHREAIRALLASADPTPRALPTLDPAAGYAAWAASYDGPGNRTMAAEEPTVHALLAPLAPGVALDAGCGTGRHTARLAALGHRTIGVDASPEMLLFARERVPGAEFRRGDLRALPAEDASADVVVCALAISHLPDLDAVGELARVLRPGGTLVLSNPHPFATAVLGARAWCRTPDGERVEIPEFAHPVGAYLEAFTAHGLVAGRCLEPTYGEQDGPVAGLPAAIVWEAQRP
ncbi:MAG: putative methyltransferase [Solirubrobacterales bacterium]|nr:putative methyltransferase [Solirubrobacterales bacterium]